MGGVRKPIWSESDVLTLLDIFKSSKDAMQAKFCKKVDRWKAVANALNEVSGAMLEILRL